MLSIAVALAVSCGKKQAAEETSAPTESPKIVVAYFSATGTTEKAAQHIAELTGGELYRITPAEEYTSEDLDWRNDVSRSSIEMNDTTSRPALGGEPFSAEGYDIVLVGYPIWWNVAPRLINTFIESHQAELTGKKVIPFATSGSSTIENSTSVLKSQYPAIEWQEGILMNGDITVADGSIMESIGR